MKGSMSRTIGPGGYHPDKNDKYAFINQVGDIRLEANLEYRFRLIGDLHGAIFLDAGNVWLMRDDLTEGNERKEGRFRLKDFPDQIALGTGAGLRYDMDFLVFRVDCGIGLHVLRSYRRYGSCYSSNIDLDYCRYACRFLPR